MDVTRLAELPQLGRVPLSESGDSDGINRHAERGHVEGPDALAIAHALVALELVGRTLPIELVGTPAGSFYA
jgi:hypothetical protein